MVLSGSQVLSGSRRFSVVLVGSSLVLNVFSVVLVGSHRFSVVLSGCRMFSVVLYHAVLDLVGFQWL